MIQAIAAFSGGLWVQNRLSDLQLPHLSRRVNEAETFKLSVRVIAASIPGLSDNGLLTRERPRVAAVLGNVRKETEFGDVADDDEDFGVDDDIPSCDWKFNETLTFAASVNDIMAGQTVQLWLHTKSDVYLGPFQMNLARNRDVGVCSVEIRKQILPECVPVDERAGDSARHGESPPGGAKRGPHLVWETKVLPFALTHVDSNSGTGNFVLGQAAGHVLIKFSMNADPQAMLRRAETAARPLVDRVADPFKQIISAPVRWVEAATEVASCDGVDPYCGVGRGYREVCSLPDSPMGFGPPVNSDLPADGWVKHLGPDGREFWHHLSLGPPPWDGPSLAALPERPVSINGCVAGTEEDSVLRVPSKEKLKEGTQIFNLDLNKGQEAHGTSSQQVAAARAVSSQGLAEVAAGRVVTSQGLPGVQEVPQRVVAIRATSSHGLPEAAASRVVSSHGLPSAQEVPPPTPGSQPRVMRAGSRLEVTTGSIGLSQGLARPVPGEAATAASGGQVVMAPAVQRAPDARTGNVVPMPKARASFVVTPAQAQVPVARAVSGMTAPARAEGQTAVSSFVTVSQARASFVVPQAQGTPARYLPPSRVTFAQGEIFQAPPHQPPSAVNPT